MRTIFPNRRAAGFVALLVLAIFILTTLHLNQSGPNDNVVIARDIVARKNVVDKIQQVQAPAAAEDEIKEHKENPELPEGDEEKKKIDRNDVEEKEKDSEGKGEDKEAVAAEPPKPKPTDLENAHRREFIKNMTKHAWEGYRKFAWGYNEVKPMAQSTNNQPIFGGEKMGATIVDGADTLYIMGLHDEFQQAREFIRDNFTIKNAGTVSVFETTIRFTGGLLSLYALTKDELYLEKAIEIADALLPAFDTKTGIAKSLVNVKTGQASNYGWVTMGASILSEFGSLHLEYLYLSQLTGKDIYREKVQKIRDVLQAAEKKDGLYANYMQPENGLFVGDHVSLGALGDSYYEYLIKSYVHTNREDKQAYYMYRNTSEAMQKHMIFTSKQGLKYAAELRRGTPEHKMSHLSCFCPGMFALEADVEQDVERKRKVIQLAEDLGHTCHESYRKSDTGIGPEMFYFNGEHGATEDATAKHGENGFILRPEAMEGWFYLWRLTGKEKYRQWVWDAVVAMEKYCRKPDGYVGLRNVYKPDGGYDDVQQSFFIAETLKYAYLTFADDEIPLNKWVFNTEAHPFPIGFENMKKGSKTL